MRTTKIAAQPIHLTYRLYGSIPNIPLRHLHASIRLTKLRLKQDLQLAEQAADVQQQAVCRDTFVQAEIDHYLRYDGLLDHPSGGPTYLSDSRAKEIIMQSWQHIARQRNLRIYAISVMSNHVHVLLEGRQQEAPVCLLKTLEDHKKYTATLLNRMQGTKGRRVWAEKEYTRDVRYGTFERVLWYVLNNPVKAGLTEDPLNWVGNWYAEHLYEAFIAARVA